jgi:hypothetical protein
LGRVSLPIVYIQRVRDGATGRCPGKAEPIETFIYERRYVVEHQVDEFITNDRTIGDSATPGLALIIGYLPEAGAYSSKYRKTIGTGDHIGGKAFLCENTDTTQSESEKQ